MSDLCNTFEQLKAAGGGVAIMPAYTEGRSSYRNGWKVLRVNTAGQRVVTDPKAHFTDYGCKRFFELSTREAALEEAKVWVAATYGEHGPWKRNRMGDYLPERIHEAFPLRPRPKRKK